MKKRFDSSVTGSHDGTEYDSVVEAETPLLPQHRQRPRQRKQQQQKLRKSLKKKQKESEATAEKAPEDYSGTVVVYSPHDADPLNAGVNLFMEKYPNVKVEVVAAGTGELLQPYCS